MQVTETLSQGLKREYSVVVSAGDLASKLDSQLADLKAKVKINGFRPGKVPIGHLKRVYGRSVMAEVVQETINAANKQIMDQNGLRLALEPKIELPSGENTSPKFFGLPSPMPLVPMPAYAITPKIVML